MINNYSNLIRIDQQIIKFARLYLLSYLQNTYLQNSNSQSENGAKFNILKIISSCRGGPSQITTRGG